MKLHWLGSGTILATLMLASPVRAGKLQSWNFNPSRNSLEIYTSDAVQPEAQLVFNPTRLVIDLPDTDFISPQLRQPVGGRIRNIRVAQFNRDTTRIVVELASGYTLDPKRVQFVSTTPNRWKVQLPDLQRQQLEYSTANSYENNLNPNYLSRSSRDIISRNPSDTAQIESIRVTGDGFFIRTSGEKAKKIKVKRSRNRKTVYLEIFGANLSPTLREKNFPVGRHGVSNIEITKEEGKKSKVRLALKVDKESPDWRASYSSNNALILIPKSPISKSSLNNSSQTSSFLLNPSSNSSKTTTDAWISSNKSPANIKSLGLSAIGSQLMIRADRPLAAKGGWDRRTGLYRIKITNANLAENIQGPRLNAYSPILRVRLQKQDPQTVLIFVQPAPGVQIGNLNQLSPDLLTLDLQRTAARRPSTILPPLPRRNSSRFPRSVPPLRRSWSPPNRRYQNERLVVMIDPGHGGKDPGAIGIGGLREKDIILPISIKVSQILRQNGIRAILTRNSDYFVSLRGRVDVAQRANANIFVSIHANSLGLGRPDVSGLEVYYFDSGLRLAQTVRRSILRSVNVRDRRIRRAGFYVLRKTSMPAILIETGYVTGREDAAKLRSAQYREQMAQAIANGILQYLKGR
ncbi:N-acetylmuramoyl-L-alanine amidase [Mastigocoleus testarum]|uniref:N-acetylmuramoyl-L-alanine amidase n=1 Tax=Mastigocoleus testarum BC008 TaxID=371196 RepID=A0A0V7ZQV4_9CYAN|nr:N-acetylmuramoyl-L-alanine amidase [Mastigocoleus testarum]KST64883.1 N-acetylmuramoyl-L-alanine amidase [Mastigocoleus testarum BC008]KST67036.1 N-acetylmuramoyl-L-alanine amidase [Mastigocoleus testarum BC008]